MLQTKSRILLDSGKSILSVNEAARILLRLGRLKPHQKVEDSVDARAYELVYGESIISDALDIGITPEYQVSTEDQEQIIAYLYNTPRDNTDQEAHSRRLDEEIEYFVSHDKVGLLCVLQGLIERFKKEGIVWGVGRGSSCASYVLYLLEVHDINPIIYDIPLREFTKE